MEPWHTLSGSAVKALQQTPDTGLSEEEAAARLARDGYNRLAPPRRHGPLLRFLRQFHNILLYVMLAGAVITASLGHWVDTGVLLVAVIVNAVIGFIQEGKAEAALDAIRAMLSPQATVQRDGQWREIDAAELVQGDVVRLASGDKVPADLRLVETRDLKVEEAALTGESVAVEKTTEATAEEAPLAERFGMAYAGTVVVYGQATGIVVATADATELGKINSMLANIQPMTTPLLRQMDHFGRILAGVILAAAAGAFFLGAVLRSHPASEMFMMAVALVASAIPEGLPAIMTITLALGVQRMARRNAIVRRLPAVETLGSVTVICSDKTGTLTRNEMTVQRVVCAEQSYAVSGVGYKPSGEFSINGRTIELSRHTALLEAIRAGVLCNDARLQEDDGQWQVEGDPTEGALLVLGGKAHVTRSGLDAVLPRVDVIPFESANRYMATAHRDNRDEPWLYVKGAPERLLDMCTHQLHSDGERPIDVDYWRRMSNDIAAQGLRLLALARKRAAPAGPSLLADDVREGFTLLALVGIIDPPREEAIAAVRDCHRAGIQVKMITGDHAETARAIGARLGIGIGRPAMTGAEIQVIDDNELRRVVREVDVFARASPEHKLRLVQALRDDGHVVAMTGDGVNDAPALKSADVGVAMGLKGTEAAKESADMVLADDNFASIAAAVYEGRAVYDNLKKFILFMLPTNGGESLIIIAAILFNFVLPLTPAQVLWVNMVTSAGLGLALAFEPAEAGIMNRRPRPPGESLLSAFFAWRVAMVSVVMMTGGLGLFLWELDLGSPVEKARTMAVNTLVLAEMFYLFNSRFFHASVLNRKGLFGNPYVLLAIAASLPLQVAFIHLPLLQGIFGSVSLSPAEWLKTIAAGGLVFVAVELEKAIIRHFGLRGQAKETASD